MLDMPERLRPFYQAMDPYQQRGAALLVILNASANPAYKSRYRRRWWQMLEERAKLGALTSATLVEWSSSVCSRLGGTVGRNASLRVVWQDLVSAGEDSLVLDALERSTPALIAFVRAWQDIWRAAREEGLPEDDDDESLSREESAYADTDTPA